MPLETFRGDAKWVHSFEGHAGKAYWPGGESGVTLDPGVDLGYAEKAMVERNYVHLLTPAQWSSVQKVLGLKGQKAKEALEKDATLRTIRISRAQANRVLPHALDKYWAGIVRRFPTLVEPSTPGYIHSAMLSLAYNRGVRNKALGALETPIKNRDWRSVANIISDMQQNHSLSGIRKRRRKEGDHILQGIADDERQQKLMDMSQEGWLRPLM